MSLGGKCLADILCCVVVGHGGQDYGSGAPFHHYHPPTDLAVVVALNAETGINCSLPDVSVSVSCDRVVIYCILSSVISLRGRVLVRVCVCFMLQANFAASTLVPCLVWKTILEVQSDGQYTVNCGVGADFLDQQFDTVQQTLSSPANSFHCLTQDNGQCVGASEGLAESDCYGYASRAV